MGFKARQTYKLVFDGELEGLVIRATGLTVNEAEQAAQALADGGPDRARTVLELFAECIVDWNLVDDDDEPLPISVESLTGAVDQTYVTEALTLWLERVRGRPSAPLSQSSSDGEPSGVLDLPMEASSESLAS